jgi:hypothetical protein
MSAAAESHVHINAAGLDVKPANALLQEHRYVITLRLNHL